MIRSPLGLRLQPSGAFRDQCQTAAKLGARGVVADATGELAPERLSGTGRREVRHLLRSLPLELIALHLPTRRPFDTEDQLEDRLARADRAFAMTYELGGRLVLARVGALPSESAAERRATFTMALRELGHRADRHGVRLAIETGTESGESLRGLLAALDSSGLAASIDPAALLRGGFDPALATRALGPWVAHAYANDATRPGAAPQIAHPRGPGYPPGAVDWEEYLGALEEISYRGFLTIAPDPAAEAAAQFTAMVARLQQF
jgi:sugar phosphate isomerase/epimerase